MTTTAKSQPRSSARNRPSKSAAVKSIASKAAQSEPDSRVTRTVSTRTRTRFSAAAGKTVVKSSSVVVVTESVPTLPAFKVGDNAVYPNHGVAVVKRIDKRLVGGKEKSFYVLQVLENQMTIMVPMENAQSVGLRGIITDQDVREVYRILKDRDVKIDNTTWNRRYREYMEKIKTGSVYEVAEVLRNLFLLRHNKDLSFGERKMLDQAKSLLVREISLAKSSKEDLVEQEIQAIFAS